MKNSAFFHRGADTPHLGNPETVQFHTHLCGSFCFRKGKSKADDEEVGRKGDIQLSISLSHSVSFKHCGKTTLF